MKFWVTLVAAETKLTKEIVHPHRNNTSPNNTLIRGKNL